MVRDGTPRPNGSTGRFRTETADRDTGTEEILPTSAPAVPVPLYGDEFAADPHLVYERLRAHGSVVQVELAPDTPASLVIGYTTALDVLTHDPERFTRDPSAWQRTVPPDCPVLPMMMYRPNAIFTDGAEHARLRRAVTDSLGRIDRHWVRDLVSRSSELLLRRIGPAGQADLLTDFAGALPVLVFNELFGCPTELSHRLVAGIEGIFDGTDSERANAELDTCVRDLIRLKRQHPGHDLPSWLATHPAELTDDELSHQLLLLIGTGVAPNVNLIGNALRLLLTDSRFADLATGSLLVDDAIDEALWDDPPIVNYSICYPVREEFLAGVRLPAHQPVLVGYAAANADPELGSVSRVGNRSHLSWGAGPHMCPAQDLARLMAQGAIEALLDALPDLELSVPAESLTWRPGPFHRALTGLPVRFSPLLNPEAETSGGTSWPSSPAPTPTPTDPHPSTSTPPAATSTARQPGSASRERRRWWHSLVAWLRG